jgi:hypothetical protein
VSTPTPEDFEEAQRIANVLHSIEMVPLTKMSRDALASELARIREKIEADWKRNSHIYLGNIIRKKDAALDQIAHYSPSQADRNIARSALEGQ